MAILRTRQPQKQRRQASATKNAMKNALCFLWLDPVLLKEGGALDLGYEVWQEIC